MVLRPRRTGCCRFGLRSLKFPWGFGGLDPPADLESLVLLVLKGPEAQPDIKNKKSRLPKSAGGSNPPNPPGKLKKKQTTKSAATYSSEPRAGLRFKENGFGFFMLYAQSVVGNSRKVF